MTTQYTLSSFCGLAATLKARFFKTPKPASPFRQDKTDTAVSARQTPRKYRQYSGAETLSCLRQYTQNVRPDVSCV